MGVGEREGGRSIFRNKIAGMKAALKKPKSNHETEEREKAEFEDVGAFKGIRQSKKRWTIRK